MSFNVITFIEDYNRQSLLDFGRKYRKNLPSDLKIADCLLIINQNNLQCQLIDENWYGDQRDEKVHYLVKDDEQYKVFQSERNGQHYLETFKNLDDAIFAKLDAIFNELRHSAPDSKINA